MSLDLNTLAHIFPIRKTDIINTEWFASVTSHTLSSFLMCVSISNVNRNDVFLLIQRLPKVGGRFRTNYWHKEGNFKTNTCSFSIQGNLDFLIQPPMSNIFINNARTHILFLNLPTQRRFHDTYFIQINYLTIWPKILRLLILFVRIKFIGKEITLITCVVQRNPSDIYR